MRVLIIKTSSMGDVIHTLPALTDAGKALPGITFDWVVEENFAQIPTWHPLVRKVIPVAWRRWRKNFLAANTRAEWKQFRAELRAENYDFIIDAQGLLKSVFFSLFARGVKCGFDFQSARETMAALFYEKRFSIAKKQHAITRSRQLLSAAIGYALPTHTPDYGIDRKRFQESQVQANKYLVFLHGTTWNTKHWPEKYWHELVKMAEQKGFQVKLPWGNVQEQERAQRIAAGSQQAEALPRLDLLGLAKVLANAVAVVGVDTGLCHLAAALDVPTVSLYGPTDPMLSGALGRSQVHLQVQFPCAPCMGRVCTYRGDSPLYPPSPLKSSADSPFRSVLGPPCFSTLSPSVVWNSLSMLF
jgi:heptosyltransferase-1